MADSISTNEQMIKKINDVLGSKCNAVINIVNDKLQEYIEKNNLQF
ncbi:hypothetical protein [Oribacterium sp. FC2011]|nr:hypothetical protein [Oribacterium sp. FC2011]